MQKVELVHIALENLQKNTHIMGVWEDNMYTPRNVFDGIVTLIIDNKTYRINADVKRTLRNHQLYQIIEVAKMYKPFMLVAEHIFPKIKEELRHNNIAYLEANGNIYLNEPEIYLWVENQKPIQREKEKVNRAFSKAGLKVVFHFLLNEDIVNYPYRDIAQMGEIGLGNVSYVMNSLKEAGFLIKTDKNKLKLINKKELLEKWMSVYAEKLKPSLHMGNFRFLREEDYINWKQIPVSRGKTFWGGEPAAEIMTNYLRSEILTLYTEESRIDLIKHYKLVPDDKGKIKVYKKFWKHNSGTSITVDPLLIYADLMNTGEGRCMETAKMIFDEYKFAEKF